MAKTNDTAKQATKKTNKLKAWGAKAWNALGTALGGIKFGG
jgi:hypothetical protein